MSEKTLKARLVNKHDIEANWLLATNFTPKQGEIIVYDIDENYSYERFKIGDGTSNVNDLPFATDGYVSYNKIQALTDEQKQQAQDNIGFSEDDALALVAELSLVEPVSAEDGSIYTDENGVIYTL